MATGTNVSAAKVLSHQLVVWAAWLRVDEWYRSGNLAPQPELCQWRLHPQAAVRRLAEELDSGKWQPSVWSQLPYPKKGACLRHYVMPTVKDQVAFMAYLILLGPLLDKRFLPFVFGNRLYRPFAWNTRSKNPQWEQRRYPLLTKWTYLPYARSHGLFRRVANWTVSRMTKAALPEKNYADPIHRPIDYDTDILPRWAQEEWWFDGDGKGLGNRAYWASLDIQLAYPSVRLSDLSKALRDLSKMHYTTRHNIADNTTEDDHSALSLDGILDGYPQTALAGLGDQQQRIELSMSLIAALKRVEIADHGIPTESWKPFHARATLPPENKGLPTGLAISGLLLNVVLHRVDQAVHDYLAQTQGKDRGAVVRFADDMYLMARSPEGLFRLIDVIWGAVENTASVCPIKPRSKSNLYLNLSKVGPEPVKDAVYGCLQASGWSKCEKCPEIKPSKRAKSVSLHKWWESVSDEQLRRELARTSVGPGDVGPFVTTLVERLSKIGKDTLTDRFGEGARERQIQLHDLARFDIKDEQVRADTRRTFAANRLASAWLSTDRNQAQHELLEIRRSVANVFTETPWKFSLWGAVVRAAGRRVTGAEHHCNEDDEEARSWLAGMLRFISIHNPDSWLFDWPEESVVSPHRASVDWRSFYLSYHRTAFWQALANVIGLLHRHHQRHEQNWSQGAGPSPDHWATRAVPEGLHGHVAEFLGNIDTWVKLLYGNDAEKKNLPRWELDHFVAACLAPVTRLIVAEEWRRCKQDATQLAVPERVIVNAPVTREILQRNDRLVAAQGGRRHNLRRSVVAQLLLANRNQYLGDMLFPRGRRSRAHDVTRDPAYAIAVARHFQCQSQLPAETLVEAICQVRPPLVCDPLALWEYGHARHIMLSRDRAWPL